MQQDIKHNLNNKIDIISKKLLSVLDHEIEAMMTKHASIGLLKSGATIQEIMDFIAEGNSNLYKEILIHLTNLKPKFHSNLETEVFNLAKLAQINFKEKVLIRLQNKMKIIQQDNLYARILPDVEDSMQNDLEGFKSSLNTKILNLKKNSTISLAKKCLIGFHVLAMLIVAYITFRWWHEGEGAYKAVILGLTALASIPITILKILEKK
ncbi:MAG: hypothetical protein OFPII_43230 [Osedax symbiont Rs1]|nr:MAG: hypothetical protein OFPII_43230 [Osedax symbiont Rs1]